jgi:ABC-type hemin transport system substrate-binding protein
MTRKKLTILAGAATPPLGSAPSLALDARMTRICTRKLRLVLRALLLVSAAGAAANCYGQSIAALAKQFGGLNAAAQFYPSVSALQNEVIDFCQG